MKIYQVEELVGITKKNIRFYEDQGLLCPNRNPQNDYREYSPDDVKSMMLVSIDSIPGKDFEVLGIVKGTIVQSKNFGRDFMAAMKTLVGGEIKDYTEMLNEARQIATKRMVDEA
ncbi:MAG: heavy metal-binding domain-containing protein, partial [Treponema sp.]|nr:heavy metal-binding domain-containing protein [Treponema sp.]